MLKSKKIISILLLKTFFIILILTISSLKAKNRKIDNFSESKTFLESFHKFNKRTFYCNCAYEKKIPLLNSCGYKVFKNFKRASRIEWEHVVPASRFGNNFSSWKFGHQSCKKINGKLYKGRKCARKTNQQYRFIESDLYNLQPVIGEINQVRSNYRMSIIKGEKRLFGNCDFEVKKKFVEPSNKVRGNIARTYLYMSEEYPEFIKLTKNEFKMFKRWDLNDPVDKWECTLSKQIQIIQGNVNKIIEKKCNKIDNNYK